MNELDNWVALREQGERRERAERKYAYEQAAKNYTGGWLHMKLAPTWDCINIRAELNDGTEAIVHYASDHSGECQPAFEGWFRRNGGGYVECTPLRWRPRDFKKGSQRE